MGPSNRARPRAPRPGPRGPGRPEARRSGTCVSWGLSHHGAGRSVMSGSPYRSRGRGVGGGRRRGGVGCSLRPRRPSHLEGSVTHWPKSSNRRREFISRTRRLRRLIRRELFRRLSLLRNRDRLGFLYPKCHCEGRSAAGTPRLEDGGKPFVMPALPPGSWRREGHGASLPVMRASAREEMRRISLTIRSSSRLFAIHSRYRTSSSSVSFKPTVFPRALRVQWW